MRRNVVLGSALVLGACIAPVLDATKPYVPTATSWAVRTPGEAAVTGAAVSSSTLATTRASDSWHFVAAGGAANS
jgi:hypothetical protein